MKKYHIEENTPFQTTSDIVGVHTTKAGAKLYYTTANPSLGKWTLASEDALDEGDNVVTNVPAGTFFKVDGSDCYVSE